jgi:hypothetical protein
MVGEDRPDRCCFPGLPRTENENNRIGAGILRDIGLDGTRYLATIPSAGGYIGNRNYECAVALYLDTVGNPV